MFIEGNDCWVQDHDGAACATPRQGVYGVEVILWKNEDGSPVKGVQQTPLCSLHKEQAERDGVLS
jgi:hypothetical protein